MPPADVSDYRTAAKRRLPRFLFDYYDGGALSEGTMRANVEAFGRLALRQRVLRDVDRVDRRVNLLGETWAMPVALAPIGLAGLAFRRGEVAAARAAEAAGVPFVLSTMSVCTLREVAAATRRPPWFQLYLTRDRTVTDRLLAAAEDAGIETLMLTVDTPVPGIRYRDRRSGLSAGSPLGRRASRLLQATARPRWAIDVTMRGRPHVPGNLAPMLAEGANLDAFWSWVGGNFDPTVTLDDLRRLRDRWRGRLVVKGILDADDVAASGADAIVASNHGGRQLDGAPATLDVLPELVAAVSCPVLLDGGVRSGTDLVRALALGAKAVMIGRPWVYGLAADGENGVSSVLAFIAAELRTAMALTGARIPSDLGRHVLSGIGSTS